MRKVTVCPSRSESPGRLPEVLFRGIAAALSLLLAAAPALAAEHLGVCTSAEREAYLQAVRQAVISSWKSPYPDRSVSCTVLIQQDFRGEVVHVGIADCGDDARVHKSVVNAGYHASPIPKPANKACFSRDIIIRLESRTQDFD